MIGSTLDTAINQIISAYATANKTITAANLKANTDCLTAVKTIVDELVRTQQPLIQAGTEDLSILSAYQKQLNDTLTAPTPNTGQ